MSIRKKCNINKDKFLANVHLIALVRSVQHTLVKKGECQVRSQKVKVNWSCVALQSTFTWYAQVMDVKEDWYPPRHRWYRSNLLDKEVSSLTRSRFSRVSKDSKKPSQDSAENNKTPGAWSSIPSLSLRFCFPSTTTPFFIHFYNWHFLQFESFSQLVLLVYWC